MTRSDEQEDTAEKSPAEYARLHQKAFRAAFDYLTAHFPPGKDIEWWEQAARDLSAASVHCGEYRLAVGLLAAVYDYLDDEFKDRRKSHGETES